MFERMTKSRAQLTFKKRQICRYKNVIIEKTQRKIEEKLYALRNKYAEQNHQISPKKH
jgi:hypothetical protein